MFGPVLSSPSASAYLKPRRVVASGVDRDVKLEAWWAFADRELIMSTLRDLGIALVYCAQFQPVPECAAA